MKKFLIIFASLLVVLLLALLIVPNLINWNRYKSKIAAMVKESTGREFRIDGDIQVSIFPNLVFAMSGVHVANAPGTKHPDLMSIGTVSGKLRLMPLLRRRVVVDSFILQEPSLHLEVDQDGRANWVFATESAAPPAAKKEPSNGQDGLPINDLSLGEVRLTRGNLSLNNAQTGQRLIAKDIDLSVALANLTSPLTLALRLHLNNEPVTVDLAVDSPQRLLEGAASTVQTAVVSTFVTTTYQGSLQQKPVPGLSGRFDLNIPSVGQLATWLDRPLDRSQPDPGPLTIHARFTGEGATVALTEATIAGEALKASASGSYDGSGDVARVVLKVESDTLDVDRFLPPAPEAKKPPASRQPKPRTSGDIMAVFSPQPIDLSALRKTEADVRIAIQGIKAMGYEIGQVDFTTTLKGGQLTSEINTLRLYGGNVKGTLKLDGTGKALGVDAKLTIDRVKVDKLASAATGGEAPVSGIASGQLQATARGESPRRLVESLQGGITFQLGGVDVKHAPVGAISDIKADLALPGIERAPSFKGSVVYNKQRVYLDLSTDPLKKVLSDDAFVLKALVDSKLVRLGYDGKVQQRPVPGLDGAFNLNVPSVGQLASWLGQPLGPSQPDPGPLKVQAVFQGDGAKIVLKTATIEGQELQARATGSFDGSGDMARVALKVESEMLNIDRYLPPAVGKKSAPAKKPAQPSPAAGDPLASLPDTPFDLAALKKTVADVQIAIGGVRAMGYKTGRIALTTTLDKGLLTTELRELNLYGGNVKGTFRLDGSGQQLGIDTALNMDEVRVDELAKTATGGQLAVHGTAAGNLTISGRGASPRALAQSISGKARFSLGGVALKDAKAAAISGLKVELDLPGLTKPSTLKGQVVYHKDPVNLDLKLDSIRQALAGKPVALKTAVTSPVLQANYDGQVQPPPAPGLDGTLNLEVPSMARLMTWLEQPLDAKQPDPGPLKLHAVFAAKASQAALKEATIAGKALQVNATGSVDQSGALPVLSAKLQVKHADLNAYLPPPEPPKAAAPEKTTPEAKPEPSGWNTEPLDLSALSKANGDIDVQIDSLRYRDITIQPGHIKLRLKNGVFDAAVEPLQMSGGTVASTVHLDASKKAASLEYQLAISGLEARPFLKTFANSDRLSGKTEFQVKGSAKGLNQKELVRSLNGDGKFKFLDGAIHGINIPATLRKIKTLGFSKETGEAVKTDFAELSGSFVIKDGVLENRDLKMLAPLIRLNGEGLVPMPQRAVDYDVTAKLVASLEGQGGKDALAGVPIPIKVKGPWEKISYTVDWQKVFRDVASDPERLKNLPKDLQEASKKHGVTLPFPKLPGADKEGSPLEQLQQLKKRIRQQPVEPATPKQSEAQQKPPTADALKTLKDLLKK